MRVKSRIDKYLKFPEYKRQNIAVDWCINFLNVDLDLMTGRDFTELVTEYESIVMYPYSPYIRWRFQDDDDAKSAFKEYQKIAQEFIDEIKELSPGKDINVDLSRHVKISSSPDGQISIDPHVDQDFTFSFAWHLARLLNGKKFDDAVKLCPFCEHYYPILSKHKKEYCSRGCAVKDRQREKRKKNPEQARRSGNLQVQFYRLKKKYPKHKDRVRRKLMEYIEKREYSWSEISEPIRKFIEMKDL